MRKGQTREKRRVNEERKEVRESKGMRKVKLRERKGKERKTMGGGQ